MSDDFITKQQLKIEQVDVQSCGQRIDNYLFRTLKGVPKSHVYRLLRKGMVRINGGRCKPTYKLRDGDSIKIPPVRVAASGPRSLAAWELTRWAARLSRRTLYEDANLAVFDKPCGLAVHGGSEVDFGLIDILGQVRPDVPRWHLAHRLDRDTSGCLLVAKDRQTLLSLQDLFRHGAVEKQYLALVGRDWPGTHQTVSAPLRKDVLHSGERLVVVDAAGKPAVSHFDVVRRYAEATLVRVRIETGRTHQIRVHARYLGYPLAGDQRYGDRDFNRHIKQLGLHRLFLHAEGIAFHWRDEISVACPLAKELAGLLARLQARH